MTSILLLLTVSSLYFAPPSFAAATVRAFPGYDYGEREKNGGGAVLESGIYGSFWIEVHHFLKNNKRLRFDKHTYFSWLKVLCPMY